MASIPDKVLDILAEPRSVKMMGTVNNSGIPNVVVISTISVLDPETIAFADIALGKTKKNLQQNGKLTVTVTGIGKEAYQIRCKFDHFETTTPLFDLWRELIWKKMMMDLKGVAIARVTEVCRAGLGCRPGGKGKIENS
jgi:hypothetical protein